MTNLAKRPCKLGNTINTRAQMHGDENVPACDIPFAGFMLEKPEVDQLAGKNWWNCHFEDGSRGKAAQPAFPTIDSYSLADKYEGSVVIVMGLNQVDIELDEIKLSGLTLTPLPGGLVEMSGKIQAHTDIEKFVHKLIARLNTEIDLHIEIGDKVERAKSKQRDLPINTFGDNEDSDDDEATGAAHVAALKSSKPRKRGRNGARAH